MSTSKAPAASRLLHPNALNAKLGNRFAAQARKQATIIGSPVNKLYTGLINRRVSTRSRIATSTKCPNTRGKSDIHLTVETLLTAMLNAKPATMGVSLKSTAKPGGGTSNHVARFWLDKSCVPSLTHMGWTLQDAMAWTELSTPLLVNFLGLGLAADRVSIGGLAPLQAEPSTVDPVASDEAMDAINDSAPLWQGLIDLACDQLARDVGGAKQAHMIHIRRAAGGRGKPGEDVAFLTRDFLGLATELRAVARADARGRSIVILGRFTDANGVSTEASLLTIKRKGGQDLKKECYPDQAQVTMCMRGMNKFLKATPGLAQVEILA